VRSITSIADLRELAKKRVPRVLFEYADNGSYDEITLRRNRRDLDNISLRQRVCVDVSSQSLKTSLLGQQVSMPLAIAPTGLTGMFRRNGEVLGARAAMSSGIPFCLSTMSICSIEGLRDRVNAPFWFQLYLMRDRGFTHELIARAKAAACSVLVLTLDLQVIALRRQEVRRGLTIPPRITFSNVLDVVSRPAWVAGLLFGKRRTFGNLIGGTPGTGSVASLAQWISMQCDPSVSWSDVEWVRSLWPGKLVLKGILDPDDAKRACAVGADAIVVSNHGGRQLDGAPSSISVLGRVVDAADTKCEVLFDGGIQSGKDIFKALAYGARGCLIGKAYIYGMAALGEKGVKLAISIMRQELAVTMALSGVSDVTRIGRSVLIEN